MLVTGRKYFYININAIYIIINKNIKLIFLRVLHPNEKTLKIDEVI